MKSSIFGSERGRNVAVDESMIETFRKRICEEGLPDLDQKIRRDEMMKSHTSFRVGGPAQLFVEPSDVHEVTSLIRIAEDMKFPYFLMGNGSNLVISDEGMDGLVIHLGEEFSNIRIVEDHSEDDSVFVYAEAGALLTKVSSFALKNGLSGLEFASGIPGTIGGAVFMNAGAYDHDMSEVVESVLCAMPSGETVTLTRGDFDFGYRKSRFMTEGGFVLSVVLRLKKGDPEKISAQIREYTEKRTKSQPLNFPSAGSMVKRPVGYYAGTMIDQAGLKGLTVGGAQVSEKHAGFIINIGNATAKDIDELVKKVQAAVMEKYGVKLEREVRFVGRGY